VEDHSQAERGGCDRRIIADLPHTHQECILYLLYCGMLGCEGYIYSIRLEREKISIQRSLSLPARFASLSLLYTLVLIKQRTLQLQHLT
jgi:hypothetical protein